MTYLVHHDGSFLRRRSEGGWGVTRDYTKATPSDTIGQASELVAACRREASGTPAATLAREGRVEHIDEFKPLKPFLSAPVDKSDPNLPQFDIGVEFSAEDTVYGIEWFKIRAANVEAAEQEALRRSEHSVYDDERIPDRIRRTVIRGSDDPEMDAPEADAPSFR